MCIRDRCTCCEMDRLVSSRTKLLVERARVVANDLLDEVQETIECSAVEDVEMCIRDSTHTQQG